jgi:hypothetical protein
MTKTKSLNSIGANTGLLAAVACWGAVVGVDAIF